MMTLATISHLPFHRINQGKDQRMAKGVWAAKVTRVEKGVRVEKVTRVAKVKGLKKTEKKMTTRNPTRRIRIRIPRKLVLIPRQHLQ